MNLYYGQNKKKVAREGSFELDQKVMPLSFELELDNNFNILGGEWLTAKHPDILWTVPRGLLPATSGDSLLGDAVWNGGSVPTNWNRAAFKSAEGIMPLRKIVEGLVRQSKR